jgi:hypothetical protein
MEDAGIIIACYVIVFGGVGAYTWWMLRRGSALARTVRDEDKSWT